LLVVAALVVAALVFLVPRTHHGPGPLPQPAPKQTPHQVALCDTCAHDYNPDAPYGPKNQHPNQVGLAIDGNRNTAWTTESYDGGTLDKPGVGLYVDANPGVAAGSLRLDTTTPGYSVSVYASHVTPNTNTFVTGPGGWARVGAAANVRSTQTVYLHTDGVAYRYYLLWITSLGGQNQVAVSELALYTR
jgi:eukaryotic-like serine/threonine-protein kinase